jgi:hypothetical protein
VKTNDKPRLPALNNKRIRLTNANTSKKSPGRVSSSVASSTPQTLCAVTVKASNPTRVFVQLKSQLEADQPRSVVAKTVEKLEGLLNVSDASLVDADRDW